MTTRKIQVHRYPAAQPTGRHPLLFVHGGYSNAKCWEVNFIPFFQAQGYDCHAIDLSGHGDSDGSERLDSFGLDDYADDLAATVGAMDELPVLIGHSMGSLAVQRYLERGLATAVTFLAPVPPSGTMGSAGRLALSHPDFFVELQNAISGQPTRRTLEVMAAVYFSPRMDCSEALQYLPLLQPESALAVAEMATLPFRFAVRRPDIPALVMGGSEDAVFTPSLLYFTAASWMSKLEVVPGAGHMLMLDPQWRDVAGRLLDWLEALP